MPSASTGFVRPAHLAPFLLLAAILNRAAADPAADLDSLAARLAEPASATAVRPSVSAQDAIALVRGSLAPLDVLLKRSASGEDWKRYLDWPSLERLARSPEVDLETARRLEGLFAADHDGLGMKEFAAVHRAIRRLVAVREGLRTTPMANAPGGTAGVFAEDSKTLAEILRARDEAGRLSRLKEAGPLLERLADAGVAIPVVSAIRGRLTRANVILDVQERLVAGAAARPVQETAPVDEVILGIRNRGIGTTTGAVRLDFVPSSTTASFDLVFEAVNRSRTRGGQRGVTVCSSGTTDLFARRRVLLDGRSVAGLPVLAHADADSRTEGIGVARHIGQRIIRRVAATRADRMRPQAEAISAGRARDRLALRFGRETEESIGELRNDLETRLWRPLDEAGLWPTRLETSTTDTALMVHALEALSDQIGASSPPPANDPDSVLSARVHKTAIENAGTIQFSGRLVTREEAERFFLDRGMEVPESLLEEPADDAKAAGRDGGEARERARKEPRPWSVRFTRDRPVEILTEEDRVTVRLRFSELRSEDRSIGPLEIGVPYRVERHATGARLVRDDKTLDDLQVAPPGGLWDGKRTPSLADRNIRLRLRRRIDKLFPRSFDTPLELSGRLADAGPLPIEHMAVTEDGWLAIGWRSKDRGTAVEEIPLGPQVAILSGVKR